MSSPSVGVPQGIPMTTVNPNQPTLRRATYVSVADLISPYKIDPGALEEELSRANEQQKKIDENPDSLHYDGVPTELDTSLSQKRLQPPRGGFNLCLLVGKVDVVVDKNRVDGSRVRLAEVLVGDETGCVSLRARDEQIDTLKEVSQRSGAVVLRNSTLELFQGRHIRLAVTKWGKLSLYPDQIASTPVPPQKMNLDRNFSMIDLVRVASVVSDLVKSDQEEHNQQSNVLGRGHSNQGRRGVNRRASPRGGKTGGYAPPGMMQQQMYADATALQYPPPGGLHGYGTRFVDGGMMQHFPPHHHHMIPQHGYDIAHGQVPMYLHHQDHHHRNDASSTMLSAGSYQQDMHGGMPQSFMGSPPAVYGRNPNESKQHGYDPNQSPRMNPRAKTFDPSPKG